MAAIRLNPQHGIWLALLLMAVVSLFAVRSLNPPEALPVDAPADEFSGLRAAAMLATLLGDETPHPVGSAANRAVRDRLLRQLEALGLAAEVQRTIGCSARRPICANVENVIAEIPGQTDQAVVLMAHYDSVPHSPGAADDGSGVVTLLESARALLHELKTAPPRRNRILLVFTDAEEMGLLGAEAFFAEHRWVEDVRAVINIEGSGSGGPSLLLRSSNPGGHLLRAYRETADAANAYSYSQEVFARMPNDTDFTVPDRAGIASIDFAFAFEFNHYHTPLDTVANLDTGTLQHHGDNVLPLARQLAELDLDAAEDNFSYLTLGQSLWITWPAGWTIGLALLSLAGLALTAMALSSDLGVGQLAAGIGLALACLTAGIAACFGLLWVANQITGTVVSFPAQPWPWRLLIVTGAIAPPVALTLWLKTRVSPWARFLGAWLLLGIAALTLAVIAPLAANLLIVPALVAALISCVGVLLFDRQNAVVQLGVTVLALLPLTYILITIAYAMEETQGYRLAPAIYAYPVLVGLALLPLSGTPRLLAVLTVAAFAGWLGVASVPLHSEWRPQHLSLYYVQDRDRQSAWLGTVNDNPLPAPVRAAMTVNGQPPELSPLVPWSTAEVPGMVLAASALPEAAVTVEREGNRVRITLEDSGNGDFAQIILPPDAGIRDFRMAGRAAELWERDGFLQARFFANGNQRLEFEFITDASTPVSGFVVDGSHQLPEVAGPVSDARGSLAVPRHQGDQRLAFQRIVF